MFILRQEILEYVKQVGEDWTTSSFCAYAMPWEEKEKKRSWAPLEGHFFAQDLLKEESENMQRYRGS